ncbi:hypothetical protein FQN54_009753 [Arachnomyces sp. PD_36]|nr:hypothetical protein FQN54_009753 [Arachnomyces sp. PD_36]
MSTTTATTTANPAQVHVVPNDDDEASFQQLSRGDRAGRIRMQGIPTFSDPQKKREWMKQHMAAAFRFFGKRGYGEGVSGHISMRDPILADHFWMNPFAKHFSTINASDLVLIDHEGYVVEGGAQLPINEAGFWIHSEIHRARPDAVAAAHAHSVHGKTWSSFAKPIEMITQDACNFYGKLGVYKSFGGIVLAKEEGQNIAASLGKDNMAVILQNHGLLTLGRTVDEAAFLYSSLDKACESQLLAEAAAANGVQKNIISNEEAKFTADAMQSANNFYTEFQPEFDLLVKETNGEFLN